MAEPETKALPLGFHMLTRLSISVYCCLIDRHLVAEIGNVGDAAKIFKASWLFTLPPIGTESSFVNMDEGNHILCHDQCHGNLDRNLHRSNATPQQRGS
jgi:hypothetical protein